MKPRCAGRSRRRGARLECREGESRMLREGAVDSRQGPSSERRRCDSCGLVGLEVEWAEGAARVPAQVVGATRPGTPIVSAIAAASKPKREMAVVNRRRE